MKKIVVVVLLIVSTIVFGKFSVYIGADYKYPVFEKQLPVGCTMFDSKATLSSVCVQAQKEVFDRISLTADICFSKFINANSFVNNFYDASLGAQYRYEFYHMCLFVDAFAGLSVFDFSRIYEFGYVAGFNLGVIYKIKNVGIVVKSGLHLREQQIITGCGNQVLACISVPISIGFLYTF